MSSTSRGLFLWRPCVQLPVQAELCPCPQVLCTLDIRYHGAAFGPDASKVPRVIAVEVFVCYCLLYAYIGCNGRQLRLRNHVGQLRNRPQATALVQLLAFLRRKLGELS